MSEDPSRAADALVWQGAAAGLAAAVAGALSVTVAGTGTTALLIKSARVRDLLYHGQHLTASAVYGRELWASQNVSSYAVTWIFFPLIGLVMGLFGGATSASTTADRIRPDRSPRSAPVLRMPRTVLRRRLLPADLTSEGSSAATRQGRTGTAPVGPRDRSG